MPSTPMMTMNPPGRRSPWTAMLTPRSTRPYDRTHHEHSAPSPKEVKVLFFEFPEDARWSDDHDAVEFSVILRPYEGTVRIGRRVFQGLLDQRPTPERCIEAFHLQRTR